jgi:ADP-heptose:LPS heptosyltransferase
VSARGPIAVMLVNGLGDQLIALPALRALCELFPDRIELILGPGMRAMFYEGLPLRGVQRAAWADYEAREIQVEPLAAALGRCELFVNLAEWITPSVHELAQRVRPRRSIGLRDAYSEQVVVADDAHMFDRVFAIARHFAPALRLGDFCAPPVFSQAARDAAAALVAEHVRPGEKLLFVHPETLPNKMWTAGAFGSVLGAFLRARPEYRALVCSLRPYPAPASASEAERIALVDPHLELAMAVVERADLFLGVDSCFLHAADLFRLPGVALFGPTRAAHWGFRLSPRGHDVSGAGTMAAIDPGEVLERMLDAADRTTQRSERCVELQPRA